MKKLFVAAVVALAGFTVQQAQAIETVKIEKVVVKDGEEKTPIKLEELPQAIQDVLKTDTYKEWTPTAAFAVKDGEKSYFQVDVKKGEETASLKFTEDAKPVE